MDEAALIRRAAAGDEPAFEALVRRHAEAILAVARARTADRALAEEILQDTFVRLFRHLPRFRGESSLRTWLVRVALNLVIDSKRRDLRRFEVALPEHEPPSTDEGAEHARIRLQEAARVRAAIARLSEPLRLAVTLRYDAGLGYGEIGRVLDVPIGTVASRLAAALRQLRTLLTTEEREPQGKHRRNTDANGTEPQGKHRRNTGADEHRFRS